MQQFAGTRRLQSYEWCTRCETHTMPFEMLRQQTQNSLIPRCMQQRLLPPHFACCPVHLRVSCLPTPFAATLLPCNTDRVMSLASSQSGVSTAPTSAGALDARLLRLHSVFAHLDSLSPDHPASQSITLPKLKEALTVYSNYTFTQPDNPPSQQPLADKRRRRIADEERAVQDMLDAVDVTRNGRIEFNEFVQLMNEDNADKKGQQKHADDDDEWTPTKEVRLTALRCRIEEACCGSSWRRAHCEVFGLFLRVLCATERPWRVRRL